MRMILLKAGRSLAALMICVAPQFTQSVMAAEWPQRAVTLVVPFPAGSATDLLARVLGEELGKTLRQPFIVENKAGANGAIGTSAAAKARADGHTLLVATSTTHAANASLFKKLQYDPIKDFAPVSRLAEIPFVLLVNPQVPAQTVQELVTHVKSNSGKVSWGSGSSGSLLPGYAFASANELDMVHIPYKGVPPAVMDTIGNVIQMTFADLSTAAPHIKAGKLRALAVTSSSEHQLLPGTPPVSSVVPAFEMTAWFALYAPAGTDPSIVAKLNQAVHAAMAQPALRQRLEPAGFAIVTSSPEDLGLFAAKETVKWAKAVNAAGISPE